MYRRIMVIDDEESIRFSLEEGLSDLGFKVKSSESIKSSKEVLKDFRPHVVLLDLRLKDGSGLDYIKDIKAVDEDILVVMITAYGDIETAVRAMKAGAYEYVTKPFDLDEIEVLLERAFDQLKLNRKVQILEEEKKKEQSFIITHNTDMTKLLENTQRIAEQDDITVLINGETGTGKELIADFIHQHSPRSKMPMVKINCASIPKDLFESELFGHEKYAFTGAGNLKKGLIEIADGGTVFLDEVGEIPLEQQAKLLRFLENRRLKRVGATKEMDVSVRLIAATNRDLLDMVNNGLFRADLYYRLNVVPIKLMPLRDRESDIVPLAHYFRKHYSLKFNKDFKGFTIQAEEQMKAYGWPGNIRELKNMIERACIIETDSMIQLLDFPAHTNVQRYPISSRAMDHFIKQIELGKSLNLPDLLLDIEMECIEKALDQCNGNQSKASEMLQISRFALKRRLNKNG